MLGADCHSGILLTQYQIHSSRDLFELPMKTKFISLFLCLLCQSAFAEWVRGDPDCGVWVKPETQAREIENRAWLIGFLSGVNMGLSIASPTTVGQQTSEVGFNLTNEQIFLWMDKYCRTNPLSSAMYGVGELMQDRNKK